MPRNYTTGVVYFVHSPDHERIKIGVTDEHPDERFRSLQNGSPAPLVRLGIVQGGRYQERRLHERFARSRTHGEWFWETDDIWAYIRRYAKPWPVGDVLPEDRPDDSRDEFLQSYRDDVIEADREAGRAFYELNLALQERRGIIGLA